jgi:hypothetical protein
MNIETGKYYVLQSTEEDWDEKYIMHVLPKTYNLPEHIFKTDTLAIHCDMRMWQNDWIKDFFQREASEEEIELFKRERAKHGDNLQGVGEMVTGGFKIESLDELPKLIDYVSL